MTSTLTARAAGPVPLAVVVGPLRLPSVASPFAPTHAIAGKRHIIAIVRGTRRPRLALGWWVEQVERRVDDVTASTHTPIHARLVWSRSGCSRGTSRACTAWARRRSPDAGGFVIVDEAIGS